LLNKYGKIEPINSMEANGLVKSDSTIYFNSTTFGKLALPDTIFQIRAFLEEDPNAQYSLVIGSDSHEKGDHKGKHSLNVVTAIIVHRRGFGGRYFWKRKTVDNIHSLREKIYAETLESLSFATDFVPLLKKALNGKAPIYDLEIHVDVGNGGDTREMIKEVVGMVTGNGFVAKTKPEAYGASYVADKHT
jgi:predicted RNase H-related nuclease YkuK (DUF458 family)